MTLCKRFRIQVNRCDFDPETIWKHAMTITNPLTTIRLAGIVVSVVTATSWIPLATAQNVPVGIDAVPLRVSESRTAYKNGTYSATGEYGNGPSYLPVTVTLSDGIVTRVEVKTPAVNPVSRVYQRRFALAVRSIVVGRPIGDVKVGRLAGSSATSDGFNSAIEQIRQQALGTE